jgi:hypothetical protein
MPEAPLAPPNYDALGGPGNYMGHGCTLRGDAACRVMMHPRRVSVTGASAWLVVDVLLLWYFLFTAWSLAPQCLRVPGQTQVDSGCLFGHTTHARESEAGPTQSPRYEVANIDRGRFVAVTVEDTTS